METDTVISLLIVYRYDGTTGTFTVPSGGDGFYYFSTYLLVMADEWAGFDIEINGSSICRAYTEHQDTPNDEGPALCSGVTYATEGSLLI